jgi:hypothetical protein
MEDKRFIESLLRAHAKAFIHLIGSLNANEFEATPGGKWSAGQNLDHLNKSMRPVNLALRFPPFLLRLLFGKPNRKPRSYDELVERYKQKLAAGGVASKPFIPPVVHWRQKNKCLTRFQYQVEKMCMLSSRWNEIHLDGCLLPHPLLGKLTVREMLFFSAYHIQHHYYLLEQRKKVVL